MLFNAFKLIFFFLWLAFSQFSFAHQDYVIHQSYFEDSTNQLSIDQVKSKKFNEYQQILTKGYSHSTFWLKLRIKGSVEAGELILRIRPSYTDEVELFDPFSVQKNPFRRLTGDLHDWSDDEYQSLNLNFKINKSVQDRDIYLRVKSAHTYMLHVQAFNQNVIEALDRKLELIYFAYLAFLFILFVWLFSAWVIDRERVLGLFALTQLVAIFYAASMFGFMRVVFDRLIDAGALNLLTNYLIISYVSIAMYAHMNLLLEYNLRKIFKWMLWVFILLPLISGILIFTGNITNGLKLNATGLIYATTLIAITTYFGFDKKNHGVCEKFTLPISFIRSYYTILLAILLVTLLPIIGVVRAAEFSLHALFVHGLLSGLMLFTLLQYRAKKMSESQLQRILLESSKAEQEKIRREDQSRLVGMLTHELKNSLAVVDLAISQLSQTFRDDKSGNVRHISHINKAIEDINLVVSRCIDVDRLDQEKIIISTEDVSLVGFLDQLSSETRDSENLRWGWSADICIKTDPELLRVVMVNLLDNAIKYAKPKTDIFIELSVGDHEVAISVSNQVGSAGLPDQEKVFDKYYRAEKAQKNRGTGLGLWLSHSITRLLGADLVYKHRDDVVTFTIVWTKYE